MVDKKKVAIVGVSAIAGLYVLNKYSGDSQKSGGSNYSIGTAGFTETKKAVSSTIPASTPLPSTSPTSYSLPDVNIYESALPVSETKKSSSSGGSSGSAFRIQTSPNSGVYYNPAKNTAENVFNPNVPSYTDEKGQGMSVAPKKITAPAPKKWWTTSAKIISKPWSIFG